MQFHTGDTVLILAKSSFYDQWIDSNDFFVISSCNREEELVKTEKISIRICGKSMDISWIKYLSLPIFLGMIIGATAKLPMFLCAAVALICMISFSIVDPHQALKAVEWSLIILIASSFGIGKGIKNSGISDDITGLLLQIPFPNYVLPALLFLISQVLAAFITHNAAAAITFPFAVSLSKITGIDIKPLAIAIASKISLIFNKAGANADFCTPIGYQTNLMVQGPGQYKFLDYVKIGLPINLGMVTIAGVLIPLLWNIR
jgi:di/tricarboxylate transporter